MWRCLLLIMTSINCNKISRHRLHRKNCLREIRREIIFLLHFLQLSEARGALEKQTATRLSFLSTLIVRFIDPCNNE